MLLGKSRGQLLIASERMKGLWASGNDAQLWIFGSKIDALKNSIEDRNLNAKSMNQGQDGDDYLISVSQNGWNWVNLILIQK